MVVYGKQKRRPDGLALWRGSEVAIADPHDPPEGFIIFGSILSASRPIAYAVDYCKSSWSLR